MKKKYSVKRQKASSSNNSTDSLVYGLHAHKHQHDHNHKLSVSPFPSAEEMEKYGQFDEALPERLFSLIEARVKADIENDSRLIGLEKTEQELRAIEINRSYAFRSRGQIFAIVSLIFLGLLSLCFGYLGFEKTAGTIVGVTILGSLTAFTGLSKKDNKKAEEESS